MQLLLDVTVTRETLLLNAYLLPFIMLLFSFGLNYMLGAFAVKSLCKRYLPGKAEKLCFLPFVRYYYVGKLAFSGKFSNKGLSWVGIAFPIIRGIEIAIDLVQNVLSTVFVYACNLDIVAFYNADLTELKQDWMYELEGQILPSFTSVLGIVSTIAFVCSLILGGILFINFFRRFKTRQGVFFGLLSLIFIDGIFLFVCRNNRTLEEEVETVKTAYQNGGFGAPYGHPNANPYQNPYANSNPYGMPNQSPYGQNFQNPNPYATPNNPYGENGTSFGTPTHPNAPANDNPFSDLEGGSNAAAPQNDNPFGEFDNPENKN
ncbi:MAG: hypothetical protein E7363_04300 [Clostridiales bacterium]|nr:hypothetical protein [Clostridiales bacterium]